MYALNDITIVDNFLEDDSYQKIYSLVTSGPFTWIRGSVLMKKTEDINPDFCYYQDEEMYNVQMMHVIYRNLDPYSKEKSLIVAGKNKSINLITETEYMRVFVPLLSKIKPEILTRMKVNMTFNWGKQIFSGYHIDESKYVDNGMVGIYYLNTNNGYTQFENGQIVNSVANRMLFFPMNMYHSCVTATDVSNRFVINMNWIDSRRLIG
jgi:hypothetical protein